MCSATSRVTTRRLTPDDWHTYREIRLAALKEAPYAFSSKYEVEVEGTEGHWRQRLYDRIRFVAEIDGAVLGTVSCGDAAYSGAAVITAMWVDPAFRRRGIGDLLVKTALDWAKVNGYTQMFLWVTAVNAQAERLYQRNGFVRTGASEELRPGEVEFEMLRKLG